MNYRILTQENLGEEHICCAISNNKDPQVASKKAWLRDRMDEGLVFLKSEERGKCFIEYLPAECAWVPIRADNYTFIDCFWVSGSFKGHGYANDLLAACIRDSREKGKTGLCVISSPKKKPFLSDPAYLAHKGFAVADTAAPFFELLYLPFEPGAPKPAFLPQVKAPRIGKPGFVVYYTAQCPYTAKYVPLMEAVAKEQGVPLETNKIESRAAAQAAPAAVTTFAHFCDGTYMTNELFSEKKFTALCEEYQASHR
ncbi:MAG: YoaP domain-containing protein [Oscillospiraceae bacterium]|nr:YoaP domain-containing protein [Oscillospiraceae bacterium]